MSNPSTTPTLIQSLQRGLSLIEAIIAHGPLTARAISETTGIVLPTTYHLLRTLIHEDYVCRLPDGRYVLGPQLISISQLEGRARSFRLAREAICELSAAARAHAFIGVVDRGNIVVWSAVENSSTPPTNCGPGTMLPAHATAVGKHILSQMQPATRREYMRCHPLHVCTARTNIVAERLQSDLAAGDDGMARSEQEFMYGVSCVATRLDGMHDLAALGIAYPSTRSMHHRARVENLMVDAADRISAVLQDPNTLKRSDIATRTAV
jgi:IclR family transcriptional regulator, acetate operon repressor